MLNKTIKPGNTVLEYNGKTCRQIFSINYGIVSYIDWNEYKTNKDRLPNPIEYTYLKDRENFSKEKEFRISLSAIGIGAFCSKRW